MTRRVPAFRYRIRSTRLNVNDATHSINGTKNIGKIGKRTTHKSFFFFIIDLFFYAVFFFDIFPLHSSSSSRPDASSSQLVFPVCERDGGGGWRERPERRREGKKCMSRCIVYTTRLLKHRHCCRSVRCHGNVITHNSSSYRLSKYATKRQTTWNTG